MALRNGDIVEHVCACIGSGHFFFVANVNTVFRDAYQRYLLEEQEPAVTTVESIAESKARVCHAMREWAAAAVPTQQHRIAQVLQAAARLGTLPVIQWLVADERVDRLLQGWDSFDLLPVLTNMCEEATSNGHLEVLQYVFGQAGASTTPSIGTTAIARAAAAAAEHWSQNDVQGTTICSKAAEGGHLHVLQWAREKGCAWDETTCMRAAEGGFLHILQWARENGGAAWDKDTCAAAARCGKLDILQWARETGYAWDEETCAMAATGGHLHILQWARKNDCVWNKWTCAAAAKGGHLHILQWARENGCVWDKWTCAAAAEGGHLNVLRWARENGCAWHEGTCAYAAEFGHLHVLRWALENGCPSNEWICAAAAEGGHLHVLQWARENGCDWDETTCENAAEGGHLHILQWARENGCPWDGALCESLAEENGYVRLLQWLHRQREIEEELGAARLEN